MADNLKYPPDYQSTSTDQKLGKGPMDMPDRGGPKPDAQTTSTTVNLSRTEHPVAAFGAKPGMGEVQTDSSQAKLSRQADSPYDSINATKPQVPFQGSKGNL